MAKHALPVPLKKPHGALAALLRRKPKGYRTICPGDMVRHDDLKLGRGVLSNFVHSSDHVILARVEWASGNSGIHLVSDLRRVKR